MEDLADTGAEDVSRWRQPFEAVLHKILADYEGTDKKIRDGMETGMRKLYESPYQEELSKGCGELNIDGARRVVFFPKLSDMKYYVEAFQRETPESTARRERVMKFKLMSVFYTLHRNDGALVDRFMHCGGLTSLAEMLGDDHRVIQSQVVELLLDMIAPLIQVPTAGSSRQQHLHHQVYVCMRSASFWKHLSCILAEPHEIFPKSHASCLKLLGGAIGWLRPPAPGGGVEFPPEPLEPGLPLNTGDLREALQQFLVSPCYKQSMPDIRGLAEDLLAELQRGAISRPDPLAAPALLEARDGLFNPDDEAREDASHAWQAFKKLGSEAFKAALLWPAEAAYRLAIEDGGKALPANEMSMIHSNRALVLLKAGHNADAAAAAANALKVDACNGKAAFRQATALVGLLDEKGPARGYPGGAPAAAADAVAAAEIVAHLEPKDSKVNALLDRARLLAAELGPPDISHQEEAPLDGMD
jgi:hypothetical protein